MISIVYEKENLRSACYDKDRLIGECTYYVEEGKWFANHTLVNAEYKGQGLAKKLLSSLVKAARIEGVKIVPVCSFVVKEFEEKEEYNDVKAWRLSEDSV